MQTQVENLTGQAGLQILRAILENAPGRTSPSTQSCRRLRAQGEAAGLRGFWWTEDLPGAAARRTREGQEVELESYGQLQQDGKLQRAVREGVVAGLSTRNYRRAVESVLEGYGIEKSSVSRQFVAASSNQLRVLCERRLEDLNLVVLMIDGIHFGGQVLVVALGIAEGGEKHILGVWQGATVLRRKLATTNSIESCLSTVQRVARNVKRWREGDQPLRRTATGLLEAEKKFRRIKGYREILLLKERLNPSRIQQKEVRTVEVA